MKDVFSLIILFLMIINTTITVPPPIPANLHNVSVIDYDNIVKLINSTVNDDFFQYSAYKRLAYLVDSFGPRLSGSLNLEKATNELYEMLKSEGFENVRLEEVPNSIHWVRGEENLTLFSPRPTPTSIPMIGLGLSVGGNVTAEVIVVQDFDDMDLKKDQIKDKILLLNGKWVNYDKTVEYRLNGPSMAAKYGAVGFLLRSVASKSLSSPHTGVIDYDPNLKKIPSAAISLEDADMFDRMQKRGQQITVNLYMEAKLMEPVINYNVVAELIGSTYPSEIILLGGHIDSWDTGPQTGANDDGGGFMVCFEAVRVLLKLGLRPKRTIRFVAWTGEEVWGPNSGAWAYANSHIKEMDNHLVAFESDAGTRNIYGFGFTGGKNGFEIVKNLAQNYLKPLNASIIKFGEGGMPDSGPLLEKYGVPSITNKIDDTIDEEYYFTYHHSAGDSMSVLSPDDMDRNVIVIAAMMYLIADSPTRIPRN